MLTRIDLRGVADVRAVLPRPAIADEGPVAAVREILAAVKARGDDALREFADRFDGGAPEQFLVSGEEMIAAAARVPADLRDSLKASASAIEAYYQCQVGETIEHSYNGIDVRGVHQPVDRAGCYVPGGRGAYPSTVLMTAVPARVAGVASVVLCVPPGPEGKVPDVTLAAAVIAGVDEVYALGGAQAIAAMAYGTESVAPVDVIVGPGNRYVAIAKQEVAGLVGIPSAFAGPSEIVVVADHTVDPDFVAIDLMVQAEHGPDGLSWLIAWDQDVIDAVNVSIKKLLAVAARADDIRSSLENNGYVAVVDDAQQAAVVSNAIAPEHLQLMITRPDDVLRDVRHAGAVFIGALSPASIGDYMAGPSHVLPTNGTARFGGALAITDFTKEIHIVTVTPQGFANVAADVERLATAEGFEAHAESIRIRRVALEGKVTN
ncbi:MAG: histidinol dehydrogenase [Acidimicrobiales bacterium]|jgi:histidinol dehydrogenase